MNCQRCASDRIVSASGKTSDLFNMTFKDKEYDGYVKGDIGIGGGDYMELSYCLECGQIQDTFPMDDPDI